MLDYASIPDSSCRRRETGSALYAPTMISRVAARSSMVTAGICRCQVKVIFFKHRPARARRFQHDLPREEVARDREPAVCLPDLDSDMREMEVPSANKHVCHS